MKVDGAQGRNCTTDTRIFSSPRKLFKLFHFASNHQVGG